MIEQSRKFQPGRILATISLAALMAASLPAVAAADEPASKKAEAATEAAGSVQSAMLPVGEVTGQDQDKALVQELVKGLATYFPGGKDGASLKVASPVTAQRDGDTLTVSFPGLEVVIAKEGHVVLGDVTAALTPGDGADAPMGVKIALPTSVDVLNGDTKKAVIILDNKPEMAGTWQPVLSSFSQFKMALKGIKVHPVKDGKEEAAVITLDSLMSTQDLTQSGDTWGGPFETVASNLQVTSPEGVEPQIEASVDTIRMGGKLSDFNGKTAATLSKRLHGMNLAGSPDKVVAEQFKIMAEQVKEHGLGKMLSENAVEGVMVKEKGEIQGSLDKLTWEFGADMVSQPGSLSLGFGFAGLSLPRVLKETQAPEAMVPTGMDLKITADKTPVRQVMANLFDELAANPGESDDINPMKIFGAVLQAQPRITLEALKIEAPETTITGDGQATVDMSLPNKADGSFKFEVAGLDELIQTMSQAPMKPLKQAAGMVSMVKGFGKAESKGGGVTYVYAIDIPKDGGITVNGQDMSALMK